MSLSSKSGNGTAVAAAGSRPAARSGALPRSRFLSNPSLQLQFVINHVMSLSLVALARSEGGAGATGSVLRGAGGEKENRGIRNLDGMVCLDILPF